MGTSGSETPGTTGGNSTVVLQVRHMPRHRHKVDPHYHTQPAHRHPEEVDGRGYSGGMGGIHQLSHAQAEGFSRLRPTTLAAGGENTGSAAPYTDYQGNGEAFSITPPFYKVHMWERLT